MKLNEINLVIVWHIIMGEMFAEHATNMCVITICYPGHYTVREIWFQIVLVV